VTETERAYDWARNQKFPSVAARNARLLAAEIERLEADLTTRTKAARHVACMLGGAGDQSSGAWTRDDLRKLFKFVCAEYPWMDPRNQEAAEAKGGE